MNRVTVLRAYYAATLLFLALDYLFDINVRLAFLDALPVARALYYLLCIACLVLLIRRPAWSLVVGTVESLLALSLLIITMGVRVMTVSEQLTEGAGGPVTMSEIVNFMLVGGAAWLSLVRGQAALGTHFNRHR